MTSDAKLPIATYDISGCSIGLPPYPVPMCKADDVRRYLLERAHVVTGVVDALGKDLFEHGTIGEAVAAVVAQRDRLDQHIGWANRAYCGEHDAVDAEMASVGEGVPDVVVNMGKLRGTISAAVKTAKQAVGKLKVAEAQMDRLREDWAVALGAKMAAEERAKEAAAHERAATDRTRRITTSVRRAINEGRFDQIAGILADVDKEKA